MCADNRHIRHIDELGRIVIPADLRHALGLEPGFAVALSLQGNAVLLEPHTETCAICGGTCDLHPIGERFICSTCAKSVTNLLTCD